MTTLLNPGPFAKEPYEFFVGKKLFVEHENLLEPEKPGPRMWLKGKRIIRGMDYEGGHDSAADRLVAVDETTGQEYPIEPYEVLEVKEG